MQSVQWKHGFRARSGGSEQQQHAGSFLPDPKQRGCEGEFGWHHALHRKVFLSVERAIEAGRSRFRREIVRNSASRFGIGSTRSADYRVRSDASELMHRNTGPCYFGSNVLTSLDSFIYLFYHLKSEIDKKIQLNPSFIRYAISALCVRETTEIVSCRRSIFRSYS